MSSSSTTRECNEAETSDMKRAAHRHVSVKKSWQKFAKKFCLRCVHVQAQTLQEVAIADYVVLIFFY